MRFGVLLPPFGEFAEPSVLVEWGRDAETGGWDGVFVWDHLAMWWDRAEPVTDTWTCLAAIATQTSRIALGTYVTPLPRRRPQVVARQAVAIDRLSNGRFILGVGLGDNPFEFEAFGEAEGLRNRAALLDDALDVITGLWSGDPYVHGGELHRADAHFLPTPVQRPRIPIWVAGSWPNRPPYRRAARWDGAIIGRADQATPTLEDVRAVRDFTAESAAQGEFDLVMTNLERTWSLAADREKAGRYATAGITWWLEDISPFRFGTDSTPPWALEAMRERLLAGAPSTPPTA